jgi:hypothetical protein
MQHNADYRAVLSQLKNRASLLSCPLSGTVSLELFGTLRPWSAKAGSVHRPTGRAERLLAVTIDSGFLIRRSQVPIERRPGDPQRGADGRDRVGRVLMQRPGLGALRRVERPRPTSPASPRPCGLEARSGPLADQVPLELGQGTEDMEDELAAAGGRVDRLLQAAEADLVRLEGGDRLNEVLERASEAIELPDDESIARAEEGEGGSWGGKGGQRPPPLKWGGLETQVFEPVLTRLRTARSSVG